MNTGNCILLLIKIQRFHEIFRWNSVFKDPEGDHNKLKLKLNVKYVVQIKINEKPIWISLWTIPRRLSESNENRYKI